MKGALHAENVTLKLNCGENDEAANIFENDSSVNTIHIINIIIERTSNTYNNKRLTWMNMQIFWEILFCYKFGATASQCYLYKYVLC